MTCTSCQIRPRDPDNSEGNHGLCEVCYREQVVDPQWPEPCHIPTAHLRSNPVHGGAKAAVGIVGGFSLRAWKRRHKRQRAAEEDDPGWHNVIRLLDAL